MIPFIFPSRPIDKFDASTISPTCFSTDLIIFEYFDSTSLSSSFDNLARSICLSNFSLYTKNVKG